MLALAVMPAAILAAADGVRTYTAGKREAERRFADGAVISAQAERDAFVGMRYAVSTLAASPGLVDFDDPACDATVRAFDDAYPDYVLAVVVDLDGMVRCASMPDARGVALAGAPGFSEFVAHPGFTVAVARRGAVTGREVVVAAAPLLDPDGELRGLVSTSLPVRTIEFLAPDPERAERRAIIDARGRPMIAADDETLDGAWLPPAERLRAELGAGARLLTARALDGDQRVYAVAPLIDDKAWLVAAARTRDIHAGIAAGALVPIATPFAMLAIAVLVAYFAIDRLVVQHVVYLARLTRAYGRGRLDLRPRATEAAPLEIAMLGEDLAAMAGRLEARQRDLKDAADANRVLLREVYHRVRNNLQMVASLLNFYGRRALGAAEREAMERIQSRVHAMSMVHELLYAADQPNRVRLDVLTRDIAERLTGPREDIRLDLAPVEDTAERATPFALFVNEAIANAVAHADGATPGILVSLSPGDGGAYEFVVENGAAVAVDQLSRDSIGRRLMGGFARQLRATLEETCADDRYRVALRAPPTPPA
jgi:two-component sensor histidine kinase